MESTLYVLRALSLVSICALAHGQDTLYTFRGEFSGEQLGARVAGAGDVNGDGFADLLISIPGNLQGAVVEVRSGVDGALLRSLGGSPVYSGFGDAMANAGDVDADGFDDIIVGGPLDDSAGTNAGRARVYSGADGSELFVLDGASVEARFGVHVAGVGDANADGRADFLVSSVSQTPTGRGTVTVYSGLGASELFTVDGSDATYAIGSVAEGAGDVNGDGFDDVIIGFPDDRTNGLFSGAAWIHSGLDGSRLRTVLGVSSSDQCGSAVDGVGDVNADGFDDVIVAFAGDDGARIDAGKAVIYSGQDGSELRTIYGDDTGDSLDLAAGIGDLDGDGVGEILVGSGDADLIRDGSGTIRVHSGADGRRMRQWIGRQSGEHFSYGVDAGDVNGDGTPDVLVGAPRNDQPYNDSGAAYVLSGAGTEQAAEFCQADGSLVACPCGNLDPAGGCANSSGWGARLFASGNQSVAADDLVFATLDCPTSTFGLTFMGTTAIAAPFGDGVRCVAGQVRRFNVRPTGQDGTFAYLPGLPSHVIVTAFTTTYFQSWYRDGMGPCGNGSNLSNAVAVTWVP